VAGYGLNLPEATAHVYYSNDFSLDHRLQSEDRSQRIGQTRQVVYIDLVCRDTIDMAILAALRAKKTLDSMFKSPESFARVMGGVA
jgi:SNF2 family DNA or RNA helicase